MIRTLSVFAALTAGALSGATAAEVLGKLDAAAPKFSAMAAGLQRLTYTKVLDEKAIESGKIAVRRSGKELQVLITLDKPDQKIVSFRGRKAEVYFPKLKTVQEWDLGRHGDLVDQFLLVGFGSGKELQSSYSVKYTGEETIAGQPAFKLELLPQAASVKSQLRRVDLWIAQNGAYPVQQRFVQPSGDYYLVTYSDVKLNPPLSDEALKLQLPKGVKRERPQK